MYRLRIFKKILELNKIESQRTKLNKSKVKKLNLILDKIRGYNL